MLASLGSKLAILGPPRIMAEIPETLAPPCGLFRASGFAEEAVLTDYVLDHEERSLPTAGIDDGEFVIPVTIDDLAANGLLEKDHSGTCWERSVETLTARKDEIAGLAVASDERIEACILYIRRDGAADILSLRSFGEDGGNRLNHLIARLEGPVTFPKVHPDEISRKCLETLGFRPAGRHLLFGARAQAD